MGCWVGGCARMCVRGAFVLLHRRVLCQSPRSWATDDAARLILFARYLPNHNVLARLPPPFPRLILLAASLPGVVGPGRPRQRPASVWPNAPAILRLLWRRISRIVLTLPSRPSAPFLGTPPLMYAILQRCPSHLTLLSRPSFAPFLGTSPLMYRHAFLLRYPPLWRLRGQRAP